MAESLFQPGERQAAAIRQARQHKHDAQSAGQQAKDALRDLELCLHIVIATDENRDLKLDYPSPTTMILRHARNRAGRRSSVVRLFSGPVYNCSGKELFGPAFAQ